jgi:hypothetical protein
MTAGLSPDGHPLKLDVACRCSIDLVSRLVGRLTLQRGDGDLERLVA